MNKTSVDKLKPCPFCGSTNLYHGMGIDVFKVICRDCSAEAGRSFNTLEGAVDSWNARAKT